MKKLLALLVTLSFACLVHVTTASAAPTMVGAEKCAKMCHKVQYDSWLVTKHATAEKKVECETCHGAGSDFMKLPVMKDPAAAKAAGLIAKPEKASCTASCHKAAEFKDEMLTKTHAHKKKP